MCWCGFTLAGPNTTLGTYTTRPNRDAAPNASAHSLACGPSGTPTPTTHGAVSNRRICHYTYRLVDCDNTSHNIRHSSHFQLFPATQTISCTFQLCIVISSQFQPLSDKLGNFSKYLAISAISSHFQPFQTLSAMPTIFSHFQPFQPFLAMCNNFSAISSPFQSYQTFSTIS